MLRRLLLCAALVLGWLVVVPSSAFADAVTCPPGQAYDFASATCVLVVQTPGSGSSQPLPAIGTGEAQKCAFEGQEVPCAVGSSWWTPPAKCYITPQPGIWEPTHPIWEGRYPEGMVYLCANPYSRRNYSFWALTQPPGPAAPADAATLARRAMAQMTFRAITIGMVPDEGIAPDGKPYIGLVGLPTWMWVANPTPETAGPQTRTVSAGGITVTATATLQRVVWDMGDNRGEKSVVTCGAGTPYKDSYGGKDSPTCGYRYQTQGTHTVTATSYWTVAWSGAGQSGTIPLHFTSTRQVVIGELQVLRTGP